MAWKEFKQDKSTAILTTDKGVTMVVLDKQDYTNKAQDLLAQRDTYRPLTANPTNKHKKKFIILFRTIKAQGGLEDNIYKRFNPTGTGFQNSMGYPK